MSEVASLLISIVIPLSPCGSRERREVSEVRTEQSSEYFIQKRTVFREFFCRNEIKKFNTNLVEIEFNDVQSCV